MPLELKESVDKKLLEVECSGKLHKEDYENFEPAVEKLIEQVGKIIVLFIMHDFHGWDLGAMWEDTKFATHHYRDIEKLAIVGEKKWQEWMATVCKPFTSGAVKYFDAGEEAAARVWLEV